MKGHSHFRLFFHAAAATLMFSAGANAQHFDVVGSGGAVLTDSSNFGSFSGLGAGRASVLINPSIRLVNLGSIATLSAEVPFMWNHNSDVNFFNQTLVTQGSTWGVTPGGRFNFLPNSRISPFVAMGAGITRTTQSSVAGVGLGTNAFGDDSPQFTLGYGGGADVRIFGPLKARAEIRNYSVKTGSYWDNRPVFFGGVGVQF